ncbi:ATP-binding cassette domain-containing protein [bacterium AH-315-P15]|nr:ATP-binding cassette domain-containing protein [bacterium AH-315-P15]
MSSVLSVKDLTVRFATPDGEVSAVSGVSFNVEAGECVGIVGESGSGKSQLFMAVMGLLASNGTATGNVKFGNTEILGIKTKELNKIRGEKMSMIFQDPMTSLTPHMKVGDQMSEVLMIHKGMNRRAAMARSAELLDMMRIPEAKERLSQYPHEFSGGMRQRVMIAMALLCEPKLLIADEPSTALDVTVQAQILELFRELKDQSGTAIVMITHDLGVVAGICDRVRVMYAGRFVETGTVRDIFYDPQHPYTRGLLSSMPRLDEAGGQRLSAIPGQPPNLQDLPQGCSFQARCSYHFEPCVEDPHPPLLGIGSGRQKACHLKGFSRDGEVLK